MQPILLYLGFEKPLAFVPLYLKVDEYLFILVPLYLGVQEDFFVNFLLSFFAQYFLAQYFLAQYFLDEQLFLDAVDFLLDVLQYLREHLPLYLGFILELVLLMLFEYEDRFEEHFFKLVHFIDDEFECLAIVSSR